MRRKFFTLDVFTRRRYAGNPLAAPPLDISRLSRRYRAQEQRETD